MRGRGNDQGGRWPVGIWFAMVGVSAGTVASFSLIGWTFARDLYGGGDGAEPLGYEPQTVVIEAEETPEPIGVAGGDDDPAEPAEPGPEPQIAVSPAEPRAERLQDDDIEAASVHDEPVLEESAPPQLVPVDEDDGDCGREESDEPDREHDWDGGWNNGGHGHGGDHGSDHGDHDRDYQPHDLDLDAAFNQADIELDLEAAIDQADLELESALDSAFDPAIGTED